MQPNTSYEQALKESREARYSGTVYSCYYFRKTIGPVCQTYFASRCHVRVVPVLRHFNHLEA